MAKIISLRAPESMSLQEMSEQEIETYIRDVASRALDSLPEGVKPVGVNVVTIDELRHSAVRETEVWAEWSRACCGEAPRLVDFEPPVLEEFGAAGGTPHREAARTHVESQLRIAALEYPEMHGGSTAE